MRQILPLATSIVTIIGMWLIGAKRSIGWAVGLANQVLWLWFIVAFDAWGLLPLTAVLIVIYVRSLVRWRRDEAQLEVIAEAS